jgi:hypothetical protein
VFRSNQQDQNIRPAGPPWRESALPGAEKIRFLIRPYLRHELGTKYKKRSLSVRQHPPDFRRVGWIHLHRAAKMTHALGLFRAQQMALECVRAHDLAVFRYSKALRRAAMRFQFANFWFCF